MDESRRQRKPRTSDPNFNQEKTNLIVNYLPQVRQLFDHMCEKERRDLLLSRIRTYIKCMLTITTIVDTLNLSSMLNIQNQSDKFIAKYSLFDRQFIYPSILSNVIAFKMILKLDCKLYTVNELRKEGNMIFIAPLAIY